METLFTPTTINKIVKEFEEHTGITVPKYQRNFIWDIKTQQQFILSIYEGAYIPPIVLSEVSYNHCLLTDGLQRISTLKKLFDNKIKLPSAIPQEEGGGKFFKDAPKETQNKFKEAELFKALIRNITEKQAQTVFLNLQRGKELSDGEKIHANYGEHHKLIENIVENHNIITHLKKERMAEWVSITALFVLEKGGTHVRKDEVRSFVEEGYDKNMVTSKELKNINKKIDFLYNVFNTGNKIYGVTTGRLSFFYRFLSLNRSILNEDPAKFNDFLNIYFENIEMVYQYSRKHDLVNTRLEQMKSLRSMGYTTSENMDAHIKDITERYESFKNEAMIRYSKEYIDVINKKM